MVDLGRGARCPPSRGSYYPEHNGPLRTDLKPLEITQPEGPSFALDGNLVRWQSWSLRVGMDPLEGLVLHTIGLRGRRRVRPVLYRASISEMVVPYGDPGPMHAGRAPSTPASGAWAAWPTRSPSAATAWARSPTSTPSSPTSAASRTRVTNAICMHEEDYGILWKHVDMFIGPHRGPPVARLVVSSIATVGNYEYGFYWYFYLDGTIQLEVKLTGIMSTMAVGGRRPGDARRWWRPALAAPVPPAPVQRPARHGGRRARTTRSTRSTSVPWPPGEDNPWGNAFGTQATLLETRAGGPARRGPGQRPALADRQPEPSQRAGRSPTAYKLLPGATPTLLAGPSRASAAGPRSRRHNLWVTPFAPDERRAAGDYPNQHAGRRRAARRGPAADRRGGHRHRGLAHLRRHPLAATRGLAGHAGRVLRVPRWCRSASSTATRRWIFHPATTATEPGAER